MLLGKRRYAVLVLVVLVLVLFFGGCGKRTDVAKEGVYSGEVYPENGLPKDKKVTLSAIFPVQGLGKEYFEYAVETFEKRFPNVKVDVRYIEGGSAYGNLIQSILKGGDDSDMYDWTHNFGVSKPILIEQGKLEPQDEIWERTLYDRPDAKVKDIVMADELEVFGSTGHMYVVPQSGGINGIYYNKKMFRDNGWNMEPENWDEFLALCKEIKIKNISPMVGAGKYPLYFKDGWGAVSYAIGGDKYRQALFELQPNVYKDHAYLMLFKRLEEFAQLGYFHPGTISFDHTQSQMEFLQETAAMIPVGSWIANEMRDVVSEDFEWGFMAFPGNEPGQQQVVFNTTGGSGHIWKNRPELNKKWTKEFNLWMLNLDVQQKIGEAGAVPIRRDYVGNRELTAKLSPSVLAAMDYINKYDVKTVNPGIRERVVANSEMAKLDKVIGDNIIEVISLQKKAEDAVKEINVTYMKGLAAERKK